MSSWPAWGEPKKNRLQLWWERQPLWFRAIVYGLLPSAIVFGSFRHGGITWWKALLATALFISYARGYIRRERHPPEPMDPQKAARIRTRAAWFVGVALAIGFAVAGALSGAEGLWLGVVFGAALGTTAGWLIWLGKG